MNMFMRRFVFCVMLSLFAAGGSVANAQAVQEGVVKEYKEKNRKSPLVGVELVISNASSTVSGRNGEFILKFHTMQPGQKVKVRRIEKDGYEVFNIDALEQWNINPEEPFTIVMVRSDKFKKLRDEYSRVASESYERQYRKEIELLEEERQIGKLTEEQLRQELIQLREFYDRQLENLDNYVDRFARIDLNELSDVERSIISLVQEGSIEEAIRQYEEMNLVTQYEELSLESDEMLSAIDVLERKLARNQNASSEMWDVICRQMDTYLMAGGKENYKKILKNVDRLLACSSTDELMRLKLLHYLNSQDDIRVYASLDMDKIDDLQIRVRARYGYASCLNTSGEYAKALEQVSEITRLSEKLENEPYWIESRILEASIYIDTFQHEKASVIYQELESIIQNPDSGLDLSKRITIFSALAGYFQAIGAYAKALEYSEKESQLSRQLYEENPTQKNLGGYALSRVKYGIMLSEVMLLEESISELQAMLSTAEKLWLANPEKYFSLYMSTFRSLGYSYFYKQDFANSEFYFIQAIDIIKKAEDMNIDEMNIYNLSEIYNNLGYLYFTAGDLEKSEKAYLMSYDTCYPYFSANPGHYHYLASVNRVQINLAALYLQTGDFDKVREYGDDGLKYCEVLYRNYPDSYAFSYAMILRTLAEMEFRCGNMDAALQLLEKCLMVDPQDAQALALKEQLSL